MVDVHMLIIYAAPVLRYGAYCSPNIFQECMFALFLDLEYVGAYGNLINELLLLEYVRAYIDDLLVTSCSTFEEHLEWLKKVLLCLS